MIAGDGFVNITQESEDEAEEKTSSHCSGCAQAEG